MGNTGQVIEEKYVGTHADQQRESRIAALAEAGIGRAYANRTLDDAGETGTALKAWMIANVTRIENGHGFDFRGSGAKSVELVMLAARGLLFMGQAVRIIPLVKLPRMLTAEGGEAELRGLRHLMIRDFETDRENPLRPYEVALIEALIEDRLNDQRAVSVVRRSDKALGWWSPTTEDLIEQNARLVVIA